ncbi:MAG: hypothetical protein J6Z43_08500 [Clostridiales bacterium]|nr:hypothetical protein [Clostridiales bacterium]
MNNNEEVNSKKYSFSKSITAIVMVFAFLFIVSMVLLFFVIKHESSMSGAEQQIRLSAQGGFNCEYSEAQKLYPFGEGVMKVTNERIAFLTLSGNEKYSVSVNYRNPSCITYEDKCLVFDVDGYSFTFLNTENVVYTMPTTNQIKGAAISPDGFAAVVTSDDKSYGNVYLYDNTGNVISEWSSYNSGYPLACCFKSDNSQMAVTTLNTVGAVAVPYIRVFDIIKTERGYTVEDNSFYTTDSSDILATCFFLEDNLYSFSSTKLFKVQNDSLGQVPLDFDVANYSIRCGDHIFLVYSTGVDQMNKLAIIDHNDKVVYSSDIGSQVHCVCAGNGLFAISVDNRIFVYNQSGNVVGDISVDEDILRMGFITNSSLCVVSTGGVHTINY